MFVSLLNSRSVCTSQRQGIVRTVRSSTHSGVFERDSTKNLIGTPLSQLVGGDGPTVSEPTLAVYDFLSLDDELLGVRDVKGTVKGSEGSPCTVLCGRVKTGPE